MQYREDHPSGVWIEGFVVLVAPAKILGNALVEPLFPLGELEPHRLAKAGFVDRMTRVIEHLFFQSSDEEQTPLLWRKCRYRRTSREKVGIKEAPECEIRMRLAHVRRGGEQQQMGAARRKRFPE